MKTSLLRLYPRAWRDRYGEEFELLVDSEEGSLRLWLDLLAGAVDARTNPRWHAAAAASAPEGGQPTMTAFLHSCGRTDFPPEQQRRSALLMVSASLAVVLAYFGIRALAGESIFVEALLYSAFNIALVISSLPTFLSNYPANVRTGLAAGGIALSYGFFLLVTWVAYRL